MRKILVTGGNGFLGSYVVKELLKDPNNNITILSRSKKRKNKYNENVKLIIADITDKKEILSRVRNFDIIYHIAGNIRTPKTDTFKLHFNINSVGTLNLLESCRRNGIRRFIFISTCEVYGDKFNEKITEKEEKKPSNDYARSKLLAEEYCKKYAKQEHIKITVIRPSYIYGYGQYSERLFPRLIENALNCRNNKMKNKNAHKGNNKKTKLKPTPGRYDFVYAKDAAAGIVLLGEKKQKIDFEDFNISSGIFTTIKEIFDIVKGLTGYSYDNDEIARDRKDEKEEKRFSLNIEKAKKIGYKPKYSLKRGISDFIKCYERNYIV